MEGEFRKEKCVYIYSGKNDKVNEKSKNDKVNEKSVYLFGTGQIRILTSDKWYLTALWCLLFNFTIKRQKWKGWISYQGSDVHVLMVSNPQKLDTRVLCWLLFWTYFRVLMKSWSLYQKYVYIFWLHQSKKKYSDFITRSIRVWAIQATLRNQFWYLAPKTRVFYWLYSDLIKT